MASKKHITHAKSVAPVKNHDAQELVGTIEMAQLSLNKVLDLLNGAVDFAEQIESHGDGHKNAAYAAAARLMIGEAKRESKGLLDSCAYILSNPKNAANAKAHS